MAAEDVIGSAIGIALLCMQASYVFKQTTLSRIGERTMLSGAIAWTVANGITLVYDFISGIMSSGEYIALLYVPLSLLVLLQVTRRYFYYSRLPVSIFTGVTMGILLRGRIHTGVIEAIVGAVKPFEPLNFMFIVMFCLTMAYFLYSVRPSPTFKVFNTIGLYFLMIALGFEFGSFTLKRSGYLTNAAIWIQDAVKTIAAG